MHFPGRAVELDAEVESRDLEQEGLREVIAGVEGDVPADRGPVGADEFDPATGFQNRVPLTDAHHGATFDAGERGDEGNLPARRLDRAGRPERWAPTRRDDHRQ